MTSPFHGIAVGLLDGRLSTSSPAVSPDGRHVAFVVHRIDLDGNRATSNIWLAEGDEPPRPLTSGTNDAAPTWSPDGRSLAFAAKRGPERAPYTIEVISIGGPGEPRRLAEHADPPDDLRWSPDGATLGYTARTRDERYDQPDERWQSPRRIERFFSRLDDVGWISDRPRHVYVVAADGTAPPRNLTPGPFQHGGLSWLPDSSAVVTSAQRHDTWDLDYARHLYLVSLDGGDPRQLTEGSNVARHPAVSPDGRLVAFVGFDRSELEPQNAMVGVVPIDGGPHSWLSARLDRTFQPTAGTRAPVWTDATTLLATAEDRGDTQLHRIVLGVETPEQLTEGPQTVAGFDAAADRIVLAVATAAHPAEIVDLDRGPVTELTRSHAGWEKFTVATTDGTDRIDAWLMRPAGFGSTPTHPLLLNVHGGPFSQYGETFHDEFQMQAAAGFAVLCCNPRGSSGRHTAWGQAINGPRHPLAAGTGWGSVDVDDVMAVLDAALERFDFLDAERVGMLGGSYGGFMATELAGRFSPRFRAVCSERAVNNMLAEEWSSDIGSAFRVEIGPSYLDDPEAYTSMSPIRLVRDIEVPMLLIHSEQDWRCPIGQAEELFMALRLLGKEVTFYRFPGEGHELSRSGSPVHRRMRAEIILDFFAQHLGLDGPPATTPN